jgi:hypothetical protein
MKTENTNGLAGGEKGWQACGTVTEIGVILGYDQSTYERVIGGIDAMQESAILREIGGWMWTEKEEAVAAIMATRKEAA